jgi:hypothetical protein
MLPILWAIISFNALKEAYMRRLLLFFAAIGLSLLAYGTAFYPDYAAFWLASGEPHYQIARMFLAAALLIQFVTYPPRSFYFRMLCGVIAVGSGIWAIQQTYMFEMMLFDTFSILAASIATGITALEISHEKEVLHTKNRIFVS